MIFSKVCINFSPVLQGGGWEGGGEGRVGWGGEGGVGREEEKPFQVKTRGD